jgi:hypothetical protein
MGSAKGVSARSVGIALNSQVACLTTLILDANPCLEAPAIHWLDAPTETANTTVSAVSADGRDAVGYPATAKGDKAS